MIDEQRARLEIDAALGSRKSEIYEQHIKPFIEAKERVLFEAFTNCNPADKETLQIIKLQANAIKSLGEYFQEGINSGKLAKLELERQDEN